jgi:dihydrofolate reductase
MPSSQHNEHSTSAPNNSSNSNTLADRPTTSTTTANTYTNPMASTAATTLSKPLPNLTLILAATPSLGIGKNGTLPWPQLRKEMGYFARVTKRTPPATSSTEGEDGSRKMNAVVMGRKTWDSIPARFRPLKGRVNVVVSRSVNDEGKDGGSEGLEGPFFVGSVNAALERLSSLSSPPSTSTTTSPPPPPPPATQQESIEIPRVFVIGGATLYNLALTLPQTTRILLTKIKTDYECDTFFSVDVDKEGSGWRRAKRKALEEWTGEEGVDGGPGVEGEEVQEQGVRFEFGMYVREGVE